MASNSASSGPRSKSLSPDSARERRSVGGGVRSEIATMVPRRPRKLQAGSPRWTDSRSRASVDHRSPIPPFGRRHRRRPEANSPRLCLALEAALPAGSFAGSDCERTRTVVPTARRALDKNGMACRATCAMGSELPVCSVRSVDRAYRSGRQATAHRNVMATWGNDRGAASPSRVLRERPVQGTWMRWSAPT
jgi:hypothetical protein